MIKRFFFLNTKYVVNRAKVEIFIRRSAQSLALMIPYTFLIICHNNCLGGIVDSLVGWHF